MVRHRCLTSTICAFHLGFGLVSDDLLDLVQFHSGDPLGKITEGGAPSRFSNRASTAALVPQNTHAPLSLPGAAFNSHSIPLAFGSSLSFQLRQR